MSIICIPSNDELEKLIAETKIWLSTQAGRDEVDRSFKLANERIVQLQCTEQMNAETLKLTVNL